MTDPTVELATNLSGIRRQRWKARHFTVAKHGNDEAQNEDQVAWNDATGRIAIADGATSSYASRRWAELLVNAYVSDVTWECPDSNFQSDIAQLAGQWRDAINLDDLPWYKREKAKLGAAATFLGLALDPSHKAWHVVAVGDCCLFQVRNGELVVCGPIDQSIDFGTTPALLATEDSITDHGLAEVSYGKGTLEPGDVFLLATDALAEYFYFSGENQRPQWEEFAGLEDNWSFERKIVSLRNKGLVRNDDATLLIVSMSSELNQPPDAALDTRDAMEDSVVSPSTR